MAISTLEIRSISGVEISRYTLKVSDIIMKEQQSQQNRYITLKEASQLSGYSADYIGQLIRSGKISGKKIYTNVAWVTTESALEHYLSERKNPSEKSALNQTLDQQVVQPFRRFRSQFTQESYSQFLVKSALYVSIGISALSLLVLFYVFSDSVDQSLQERARENAAATVESIQ